MTREFPFSSGKLAGFSLFPHRSLPEILSMNFLPPLALKKPPTPRISFSALA